MTLNGNDVPYMGLDDLTVKMLRVRSNNEVTIVGSPMELLKLYSDIGKQSEYGMYKIVNNDQIAGPTGVNISCVCA